LWKITIITKQRGYSIVAHAIVDVRRRFINIFVGLLGNVNDP
jgi:hypothetical protein